MSRLQRMMGIIALAWVCASWLAGQAGAQAHPPLVFRRVFVPQDDLEQEIRGLLPLKREEFERRLEMAHQRADGSANQWQLRIEEGVFRARLDRGQLTGTAELSVVKSFDQTAMLPIAPCNLAIDAAKWQENGRAAVYGVDAAGGLQCLVEQTGTLRLSWSRAATEFTAQQVTFDLSLPASVRRQLEIVAAAEVELTIDGAMHIDSVTPEQNVQQRVWRFGLSGNSNLKLHVRRESTTRPTEQRFVVREASTYSLWGSSMDVETTLHLDGIQQPQNNTLTLAVDRGLQVTAIRDGETSLPFRVEAHNNAATDRVMFETPKDWNGSRAGVVINGTADWKINEPWMLPRVRMMEGLFQEGRVVVNAVPWLRLRAKPLAGSIQTRALAAAAGRSVDRFEFQLAEPAANIEIAADNMGAELRVDSGRQITIDSNQVRGVVVAELTTAADSVFETVVQVPGQWIIDSIEAQPAKMLADQSFTTGGDGPRQLKIQLARPITPQRPLRLALRAHRRRPANNETLDTKFFEIANFPEAGPGRQLLSVRVNDPGVELQFRGEEQLLRLDPTQLRTAELRLFESPAGPMLLEWSANRDVMAALVPTTARYRGEVLVRVDWSPGETLSHRVNIRCQPEVSAVGSILVRISPRPSGAVAWRMAEDGRLLTSELESGPSAGSTADEALYRVALTVPQSAAFDIVGQWSSPVLGLSRICLATLPEAARQVGLAEIHSPEPGIRIESSHVQPLPAPPNRENRFTTLRGRFRYLAGRPHQIFVWPAAEPGGIQSAWIESLNLISQFSPVEQGQHEAEFDVRNEGLTSFEMHLAENARDLRVVLDDGSEQPLERNGDKNSIVVPLPAGKRRASVRVRFSSNGSPRAVWPFGAVSAPVPKPNLVVLAQSWRVVLPPELAVSRPRNWIPELDRPGKIENPTAQSLIQVFQGPSLLARPLQGRVSKLPSDPNFLGWQLYDMELPRGDRADIAIYRPAVVNAWSLCLALVAVAAVNRLPGRLTIFPALAVGCAAVATLASPPVGLMLHGVSFGIVAGSLLSLALGTATGRSLPLYSFSVLPTRSATAARTAGAILCFLLPSAGWITIGAAEEQETQNPAPSRAVFPIDSAQQPIGDYVYVDSRLYDALVTISDRRAGVGPDWLLENARYEVSASPTVRADRAAVEELKAVFEFHTFRAGVDVPLAMEREQVLLLERRAALDGQPITLNWRTDGRALLLHVHEPGKHRLEVGFGAVGKPVDGAVSLELLVPRAGVSYLSRPGGGELLSPPAAHINVDGVERLAVPPGDRFIIRWPGSATGIAATSALEADQLLWWRIRPGSVVVEGRFRLRSSSGPLREVSIEVDPRLKLIPGTNMNQSARVQVEESAANLVRATFDDSTGSEAELRMSWLWPDSHGAGNFLLPRIRVGAQRLVRDWTAVSLDPGMQVDPKALSGGPSAAEFAAVWGEAQAPAATIAGLTEKLQNVPLKIRPRAVDLQADEQIAWSISGQMAEAHYTAELTDAPETRFEHVVDLPEIFRVTSVALMQDGRESVIRWSQVENKLVVLLLEGPAKRRTLSVSGQLAFGTELKQYHLPAIRLNDAFNGTARLQIYRQSDVQLDVQPPQGWLPDKEFEPGLYREGFGRLSAAFRTADSKMGSAFVTRQANRPQVSGRIFISADEADGAWRGKAELDLQIEQGVLDELHLAVPESWGGPLEIEPVMQQRLQTIASEPRRRLTLRPLQAVRGNLRVLLAGNISSPAGGVQVPEVILLGHPQIDRYVLLDRGGPDNPIDWEITGLQAVPPAHELPADWHGTGAEVLRAVGAEFRATALPTGRRSATPGAGLAQLQVVLHPSRRAAIEASLIVTPQGLPDIVFSLPSGFRLVQTRIDDAMAPGIPVGLRTWKIAAPSDTLPFRLTIVYDTFVPADGELRLVAPHIENVNVVRSLWAMQVPIQDRTGLPSEKFDTSIAQSDLPAAAIVWLEDIVRALEAVGATIGADIPPSVISESYARWRNALETAYDRFTSVLDAEEMSSEAFGRAQAAVKAADEVRQRLVQAGILVENEPSLVSSEQESGDQEAMSFFIADDQSSEVVVQVPRAAGEASWQLSIALSMGLVALGFFFMSQNNVARNWLVSHAPFALGLLGVAWWLLLPLGWLGGFLLLAACWRAVRWSWPRATVR